MGRHIIWALEGMFKIGRILRDGVVKIALEIPPHVRIGILIDRQRSRGMLNEEMKQTNLELPDLGKMINNLAGDKMETAVTRRETKLFLNPFGILAHAGDYD
ncbi:MAG: hypothetical protein RIR86_432 [Acidobacteriota bacterium]